MEATIPIFYFKKKMEESEKMKWKIEMEESEKMFLLYIFLTSIKIYI